MKRRVGIVLLICFFLFVSPNGADAQCSICTRTAQQLGEKPAEGMNAGILYLAFAPMAIIGYLGFRWWKHNREP